MTTKAPHEPSFWLRQAVAARVRAFAPAIRNTPAEVLVMIMLSEPPEDSTAEVQEAWEVTCDRCSAYCGDEDTDFFTGAVAVVDARGRRITVTFGLCEACRALEGVDVG
jgi:hypothetical protein